MPLPRVQTKTILLGGGLDLETPPIMVKEGFALEANNIEPNLNGGYRKMLGFERVDGRTPPSSAVLYSLSVDDASLETINTDITGSLSGATARIIALDVGSNKIGITNLSGDFIANDVLTGGSTASDPQSLGLSSDLDLEKDWLYLAQEYYRGLIQPVPGSGSILGEWEYNGSKYAFRSNGTEVKMYCSSIAGWVLVDMHDVLNFDSGVLDYDTISIGDTITGLTSSATGVVESMDKTGGDYLVDASGYLVISSITGVFADGEAIQTGGVTRFNANGATSEVKFNIGSNAFKFVNHNFKGNADEYAMYGCDGINNAFRFNGSVITPIFTGMADDSPNAIEAHKNHLFLSFKGGSVQHSGVTDPMAWSPVLGAAELTLGEEIQSMRSAGGDVMLISTKKSVSGLYGTSSLDWLISLVASDAGDVGSTMDVLATPMVVTKRGIVRLDASQKYGNFESSTMSRRINPLLESYLATKQIVGVNLVRDKNQYRIYFSDGKGIILAQDHLYGGGALPQFTTFDYGINISSVSSIKGDQGEETVLFGGNDGYVYQEERGNNFDGNVSHFTLKLPYHHLGSPVVRKAFKWVGVELIVNSSLSLRMTYEFSGGQSHTQRSGETNYDATIGSAALWGEAEWGAFSWGSLSADFPQASLTGTGTDISLFFFGEGVNDPPFTVGSITYQYIPRRLLRG